MEGKGQGQGPPRCGPGATQDERGGGKSPDNPRTGFPWHPAPALHAGESWPRCKPPPCRGAAMCPHRDAPSSVGLRRQHSPHRGGPRGCRGRPPAMPSHRPAVQEGGSGQQAAPAPLLSPRIFRLRHPPICIRRVSPEPSLLPGTDNAAAAVLAAEPRLFPSPPAPANISMQPASPGRPLAPRLSPSLPGSPHGPPRLSPPAAALKLNGCEGDGHGKDRAPSLPACSQLPPSPWGLGSPQIAPGRSLLGCSISSISIRGGCESTSLGIPLAWVVQGAPKQRQWDLQWGDTGGGTMGHRAGPAGHGAGTVLGMPRHPPASLGVTGPRAAPSMDGHRREQRGGRNY